MTKIIGHRGAKGLAPENTIASIAKAIACKVDEIEVDIRVTSDGIPILFHDKQITGQQGNKLTIASHTLQEIQNFKPDIATMQQAIKFIDQRVPLQLEIKTNGQTKTIAKVLNQFLEKGWKENSVLIGSFSQKTLLEFHAMLPNIEKVVIEKFSGLRAVKRARQLGTKRISMSRHNLWWGIIKAMHRRGYKLAAFTVNSTETATKWEHYGLYGIFTDYPDRFRHERKI